MSVETVLLHIVFLEHVIFFLWFFDEYKVRKSSIYFKKIFCYNTIQKFRVSNFLFKEINTFILKGCVKLIS